MLVFVISGFMFLNCTLLSWVDMPDNVTYLRYYLSRKVFLS